MALKQGFNPLVWVDSDLLPKDRIDVTFAADPFNVEHPNAGRYENKEEKNREEHLEGSSLLLTSEWCMELE